MNLTWLDDESVLQSALLTELGEHVQALFEQIRAFNCGMPLVRFLVENERKLTTVEGIAFHLNEPAAKVESDLHALEKLGLARQVDAADLTLCGGADRRRAWPGQGSWLRRPTRRCSRSTSRTTAPS